MTSTALIYHDTRDHTTYFLGSIAETPGISVPELVYRLGLDKDILCKTFDLPVFPDKNLYAVSMTDDLTHSLEPTDIIPDTYLVFETPNGIRQIAIPNIGDVPAALRMCNYDLYDNIRFKDVVRIDSLNPGYREFEYDDYYEDKYAVRVDTDTKFESYNTFGSFQKAKEVAVRLHNTRPDYICRGDSHVLIIHSRLYAGRTEEVRFLWKDGVFLA